MFFTQYTNLSKTWEYSPNVQRIANVYPEQMRMRHAPFSNYKQFFNMFALEFDEINTHLRQHLDSLMPQTYDPSTKDVLYVLPHRDNVTYTFNQDEIEQTVEIIPSPFNSVHDWLYHTPPTGMREIQQYRLPENPLLYNVYLRKKFDFDNNLFFEQPVNLFVSLTSNNGNFIHINNDVLYGTDIVIYGMDEHGIYRQETFTFVYSTEYQSLYQWRKIFKIETTYWDEPNKFILNVDYKPVLNFIEDYYTKHITSNRENKPCFWKWDQDKALLISYEFAAKDIVDLNLQKNVYNDINYYALAVYASEENQIIPQNNTNIITTDQSEFVAPNSELIIQPLDYIESFYINRDYIYVIAYNTLFIYDKHDRLPNVLQKALSLKTPDPQLIIDATVMPGKIQGTVRYPSLKLSRHFSKYRILITKADGECYMLKDNTWLPFVEDTSWNVNNLQQAFGFQTIHFEFQNDIKQYFFEQSLFFQVDVLNDKNEIETDVFIIPAQVKFPISQCTLSHTSGNKLMCTADNYLSYVDNNNILHKLLPRNDTYITDGNFDIFAEDYKAIKVNYLTIAQPIPQNITTPIDHYGMLHNLERKTGEPGYQFIKRLNFAFYNPFNTSRTGMINAISAELMLPIYDIAYIVFDEPGYISITYPEVKLIYGNNTYTTSLFKHSTLSDFIQWLIDTGLNVRILNDSIDYTTMPARTVMDIDTKHSKKYNNQTDKQSIELILKPYEKILPDSVKINDSKYADFTVENNVVHFQNILTKYNKITYETYSTFAVLRASPATLFTLDDIQDYMIAFDYMSPYLKDIINFSEQLFATRWNR